MEADRVSHDIRNVAERLISLDPEQYNDALNQYFEDNVNYISRGVSLRGLNEFKKYLNIGSAISFDSHLVGQPYYDANKRVARFAFSRTIYSPTVPQWVPLAEPINRFLVRQHIRPVFDTELHLAKKGQETDDGPRYVISQVGPTERRGATLIEKLLPYLLLRPFITFAVLAFANILGFFQRHPVNQENPVKITLAAVAESWAGWRNQPIDREHYPRTIKQAQVLSEKIGQVVTQALDFTQQTAHNANERARELGLPVDQTQHYIELGLNAPGAAIVTAGTVAGNVAATALQTAVVLEQSTINAVSTLALNAVGLASGAVHLVEGQAKELGVPVDEYRELNYKRAQEVGELFGVVKAKAEEQGRKGARAALQVGVVAEQGVRESAQAAERLADRGIDKVRRGVEHGADATQRYAQTVKDNARPSADHAKDKLDVVMPDEVSNDETYIARVSAEGIDPTAPLAPSYAQIAHD
ncbi:uncharacterized protein IL334_000130 [Kwoniella shivajii]|uniref:Uncharacterized protein n=1 Tax=Kwoniella shivajii TaxID=564305 RepID=A0ABZ1CPE6_9TREE|nr:hypothetical protein IL334_000130 [Kwoniella shivajii]